MVGHNDKQVTMSIRTLNPNIVSWERPVSLGELRSRVSLQFNGQVGRDALYKKESNKGALNVEGQNCLKVYPRWYEHPQRMISTHPNKCNNGSSLNAMLNFVPDGNM